ncbi:hypothetical protein FRC0190_01256 [Corynebacterium rouxii]|uniref:Uncharacterized protein n=1 Tax=Corynebacterium rouxii TaxID=2719119 RepID=A0A6I8MHT8_9CORY|nr:hypothetical protein FRC0190_01256 [Corynebacterium rouxii]
MELASKFSVSSDQLVKDWVRAWRAGGDKALRPKLQGATEKAVHLRKPLAEEDRLRREVEKLRDLKNQRRGHCHLLSQLIDWVICWLWQVLPRSILLYSVISLTHYSLCVAPLRSNHQGRDYLCIQVKGSSTSISADVGSSQASVECSQCQRKATAMAMR